MMDGYFGEHLAVQGYLRLKQLAHKQRIAGPSRSTGGIDTDIPEISECSLLASPVSVGILTCLHGSPEGYLENMLS